jgi:Flp pilus assembly protein TadD/outer membrane protein OmpA-like peptidoglycan-associated protein
LQSKTEKNKKMKKLYYLLTKIFVFSLILAVPLSTFAQEDSGNTNKKKSNGFSPYIFLQGEIGAANFRGDLYQYKAAWDWRYIGVDGFLGGGFQFLPWMNVYGKVGRGFMGGQNRYAHISNNTTKGLYTDIDYFEANLNLGFELINMFAGYKDRLVKLTLHAGAGQVQYKTRTYLLCNDKRWATSGYDGQTGSRAGGGINGRKVVLTVPVGMELSFRVSPKIDIYGDYTYAWMDTDYADNVKSKTDGFFTDNDFYDYFNVGVRYNFRKSGIKNMEKKFDEVAISLDPMYEDGVLYKQGDSVKVKINGTFPPKYFAKDAVMNFAPTIKYEGGETILPTKVFIGDNVNAEGEKISNKNGGNFVYEATVPYEDAMAVSSLDVAPVVYKYDGNIYGDNNDALNQASKAIQLEERHIADGIIATDELLQHKEMVAYAPHGYEKVTIVSTNSSLHFAKNMATLNWKLPLNRKEENLEALKNNLTYLEKGWELKDIEINGWASPEGEETFNEGLSQRRAETAKKYLQKKLKKQKIKVDDEMFVINGNGPDWNGFMNLVKTSNLKDKNAILNVVNSSDASSKEQEIRNMILIYPELERDLLPQLRRAVILVNTFEPKKTDAEIANLSTSSPSELDVHELLYAATLTSDLNTKKTIYENAMRQFPNCWVAVVNAAAVELEMGNNDEAMALLKKAKDMDKVMDSWEFRNNMGVAQFRAGDVKHAEGCFTKAQELGGEENYNLGLVNIAKGEYTKAISLLSGFKCDFNLALAQVLNKDYKAAAETLNCADKDANTYYLMAVNAARQNDKANVIDNLTKAIKEDSSLKARALKDRSFLAFEKDPDFQALVK